MRTGALVLDTNIVLDLFVYADPAVAPLYEALAQGKAHWHATAAMREELARVLTYPHIVRRLERRPVTASAVLAAFDERAKIVPAAPKAAYTCKDPDDQKFIDLAAALATPQGATLLSKDAAVLCMARRLATLGVDVARA
ncbi:putative toxin-antitoxin system toxin component, PIN family [Hydrogenophaga sp. NFH-34]|uniref:putative toxin-antitoxin system toxin component, PIN family n=1 Tax=Hydrogenophaga sp. NFH-34 TaxID=2744446 RepID=UPI001F19610E|nr:putative toxin-antitoxin system toxin component, PIN family [Hydrogenophaga sp. NFH-34]